VAIISGCCKRTASRSPPDRVFNDDQFIDAVRTVASGGIVMDPEVVRKHSTSIFTKLDLAPSDEDNRRVLAVLA
jgi:hypothetical protein